MVLTSGRTGIFRINGEVARLNQLNAKNKNSGFMAQILCLVGNSSAITRLQHHTHSNHGHLFAELIEMG